MTTEEMVKALEAEGFQVKREPTKRDPWWHDVCAHMEQYLKEKGVYLKYRMQCVKCTLLYALEKEDFMTPHQVTKKGPEAISEMTKLLEERGRAYIDENVNRWASYDNRKGKGA